MYEVRKRTGSEVFVLMATFREVLRSNSFLWHSKAKQLRGQTSTLYNLQGGLVTFPHSCIDYYVVGGIGTRDE